MNYDDFIAGKLTRMPPTGLSSVPPLHPRLFPFQRDLVAWALRRGRCALFADTGTGKTSMQLEWARHVAAHAGGPVLILAPLAVAAQTAREGATMGVDVTVCKDDADVRTGVNITNYDRLHRFDCERFEGVALDESSIIKHHDAQTLKLLLSAFADTAFKLCATATPSPNDYTELGTHAEFLGACSRSEMLAEFFCHDGGETQVWRLKGHARKAYWAWVATWAALLRKPSDLGYDDTGYDLPPLTVTHHRISIDHIEARQAGMLFAMEASTLGERRNARRGSIDKRVGDAAALINASADPWVVWCDLNAESEALTKAIPDAIEVRGSDDRDVKEARLVAFAEGRHRVIVSKTSICGFGLNWQHAAHMAFVGVTDSWEAYYQGVRRCWRFGQKRPVNVHIFASELEGAVIANIERKEADAHRMSEELSAETRGSVLAEVRGIVRTVNTYAPMMPMAVPSWLKSEGILQ